MMSEHLLISVHAWAKGFFVGSARMRSLALSEERLVIPTGVLWEEKMITRQVKVLKDFYQLPADKSVEHLTSRLLVQLYQDQQNHSRVGLNLPHCLLSVFQIFPPLIFHFCCDFPAGSRDKVPAE